MTTETDNNEVQEQSVNDALEAAMDAMEAGTLVSPDVQPETLEEAPTPAVDAPDEPKAEQPAKTAEAPAEGKETAQDAPEQPAAQDNAPSSWKRDVAGKWADLPPEVKAEIQRRESDYHKGIEQFKPAVQFAQEMQAAITPFVRNIQASGIPVTQAVNHLLMMEDKLRNGDDQTKLQTLVKVAADYGINIQQAMQTQHDPRLWQMEQQLLQERMARQGYERAQQENESQVLTSQIQEFAQAPGHEHFEAVRQDMGMMLQSGMAQTLQEAYDKAVWARPELRQSLVEKERTEAEQRAIGQQQRSRAKSAAVGVKGSPPNSSGALSANASIEDTLAAAMDGLIS